MAHHLVSYTKQHKLAYPTFLWYLLSSLLFKSSDSTQGHFISSGTNAFTLLSGCLRFLSIFLEKCVHSPRYNQANIFARPMSNEIVAIYIMCSSGILLLFHGFTFLLAFLRLLPGRLQQSKHLTMYRQHVLRKNNLLPYSKCLFSKQTHRLTFILLVVYFFISFAKLIKRKIITKQNVIFFEQNQKVSSTFQIKSNDYEKKNVLCMTTKPNSNSIYKY